MAPALSVAPARALADWLERGLVQLLVAGLALGPAAPRALALGDVTEIEGSVEILPEMGNTTVILASDGSIGAYTDFDIDLGKTVDVQIEVKGGRHMARVTSKIPTTIDGTLLSNGHVYLLNPAGVLFSGTARVNVAGLHAAAGNYGHLDDGDFAKPPGGEDYYITEVDGEVRLEELGEINAEIVNLIGRFVTNDGTIRASDGMFALIAGKDVFVGRGGTDIAVRIEGLAGAISELLRPGVELGPNAELDAGTGQVFLGAGDIYGLAIQNAADLNALVASRLEVEAAAGQIDLGAVASPGMQVDVSGAEVVTAGDLDVQSLTVEGDVTFGGDVTTSEGIDISGGARFLGLPDPAADPNGALPLNQRMQAGTAILVGGDISKASDGNLTLLAPQGIEVRGERVEVRGGNLFLSANLAFTGVPEVDPDAPADPNGFDQSVEVSARVVGTEIGGLLVSSGQIKKATRGSLTVEGRALSLGDRVANARGDVVIRAESLDLQVDVSAALPGKKAAISVETAQGNLTVGEATLSADRITLQAGNSTGTATVRVIPRVGGLAKTFEGTTPGTSPDAFELRQDAAIDTAADPDVIVDAARFGAGFTDLAYTLRSDAGGVTLDQAGADRLAGTASLELAGRSGVDVSGVTLSSDGVTLRASDGAGGEVDAEVALAGARFLSAGSTRSPASFALVQDASIGPADVPESTQFAGAGPTTYRLESVDGSLTVGSPETASRISGMGGRTVELVAGDRLLLLASLKAKELDVRAGTSGTGNLLLLGSTDPNDPLVLAADEISVGAGDGAGRATDAQVILANARFERTTGAAPLKFTFEQDAPLAAALPLSSFGGPIDGMTYTLRSHDGDLTIDDTTRVAGTELTLAGGIVDVDGSLLVRSLDVESDAVLDGDVWATAADDPPTTDDPNGIPAVRFQGRVDLDGDAALQTILAQQGGVSVAGVVARPGGDIQIRGLGGDVKLDGGIDADGGDGTSGGNVTVFSSDALFVSGTISARGGFDDVMTAPGSGPRPEDGGNVLLTGQSISVARIDASGANGTFFERDADEFPILDTAEEGGQAGTITLSAPSIKLGGDLVARGGRGPGDDVIAFAAGGADANVELTGSALLASNVTVTGAEVTFVGRLAQADDLPSDVALTVLASDAITLGGDARAGRIGLHAGTDGSGDLNLLAVSVLEANDIELAAGDGEGGDAFDARVKVDLGIAQFLGLDPGTSPNRFVLAQDASIDATDVPDPNAFGGGIDGMQYELRSADRRVTVANASDVSGTRLTLAGAQGVSVASGDLDVVALTLEGDADLTVQRLSVVGALESRAIGCAEDACDLTILGAETVDVGGNVKVESGALEFPTGAPRVQFGGDVVTRDQLDLTAVDFVLDGTGDQRLASEEAELLLDGLLVKLMGNLALGPTSPSDMATVSLGSAFVRNGGLTIETPFALEGNHLTATDGLTLNGEGTLESAGDVVLRSGDGPLQASGLRRALDPTDPNMLLPGNLTLLAGTGGGGDAVLDGTYKLNGDLKVDAVLGGGGNMSIDATGQARFLHDVDMDPGSSFEVQADTGIRFLLPGGTATQTVRAGSIALNPEGTGLGEPTITRIGDLVLDATSGAFSMGTGQSMTVLGDGGVSISAAGTATVGDISALSIRVAAPDIVVDTGSAGSKVDLVANNINFSTQPRRSGTGSITFGVPTGAEVSDSIVTDDIVVRAFDPSTRPVTKPDLFGPIFKNLTAAGPARFEAGRQSSVERPVVDDPSMQTVELVWQQQNLAAVGARPLWAAELLAFLDPDRFGTEPAVARVAVDPRLATETTRRTRELYRQLFAPSLRIDPESGERTHTTRAETVREALAETAAAFATAHPGVELDGPALLEFLQSGGGVAEASLYVRQVVVLLRELWRLPMQADELARVEAALFAPLASVELSQEQLLELAH